MYNYGIGGNEVKGDASEAFADIPQNRTLMIEKLTADPAVKPQIVEGLQTIEQVFDHFKPNIDVEFTSEEGAPVKENLKFSNLGDYGIKGLSAQSNFLQEMTDKKNKYDAFIKQLKTNKVLMNVLNDKEAKQAYLDALNAMIQELEDSK